MDGYNVCELGIRGYRVGESSESIRARVLAARNIQQARFTNSESRISHNGSSPDIICNADMRVGEIRQFCKLQDEGGVLTTAGSAEASKFDVGAYDCRSGRE